MQLAELLFFGVVEKNIEEDTYPKKSEYQLTDFGKSILLILSQIDQWATHNSEFVIKRQNELQENE